MSPEQLEECGPYDDDGEYDGGQAAAEDWAEGQCDNCAGSTAEDLKRANYGNGVTPVCACAMGIGATPDACVCGPGGEVS